jgi:hypothetical protein
MAAAQDASRFDYGEIEPLFEPSGVRDGYVDFGSLGKSIDRYFDWKSAFADRTGFNYVIENRTILQWGDGATVQDNELNLIGRWDFADGTAIGDLSFNVWGQFANSLGENTSGDFQTALGVLSPLNGGNSGPDHNNQILQMFAVEGIVVDRFRWQVGKLSTRTLVNLNRLAHGDSETFFSPMLGNNPVVPYTALLGIGAFAQWRADSWYVSGLVRAPDTELGLSTSALEAGEVEYIGEFALTPTIPGLGYGEYRLTWSYLVESDDFQNVTTFSASFDQDIGDRFGAFFRYAEADNTFRDFRRRVAGGAQIKQPFGLAHDRIGIGIWNGTPTDPTLDDERGIEAFYNAQVGDWIQITPNIQHVRNPAFSASTSETVFGLRLRIAL